jgi:hypothetical protein
MYLRILTGCVQQLYATQLPSLSNSYEGLSGVSCASSKAPPVYSSSVCTAWSIVVDEEAMSSSLSSPSANRLSFHETVDTAPPSPRLSLSPRGFKAVALVAPLFSPPDNKVAQAHTQRPCQLLYCSPTTVHDFVIQVYEEKQHAHSDCAHAFNTVFTNTKIGEGRPRSGSRCAIFCNSRKISGSTATATSSRSVGRDSL